MSQDTVQPDPKYYMIEVGSEKVRVRRVFCGPYEKSPMRTHPSGVIAYLTDRPSKRTDTAGASREMRAKPSVIHGIHDTDGLPENLSSQPMAPILMELKESA